MVKTYLEFGEKDKNHKRVYDSKAGLQAYEWFMTSRYFSDILCYRNMTKQLKSSLFPKTIYDNYLEKIHRTNDISYNFKKLLALEVVNGKSFLELGSSLFGCIDGMLACKEMIDKYTNDIIINTVLEKIDWYGIDISDFMNELAKISYPKYKLHLMNSLDEMNIKTDVFFAKGISLLYAIRKPDEFKKIVDNNTICLFDYSFALKKRQTTTIGSGVEVEYLTLKECLPVLKNGKEIYINTVNHDFSGKDRRFFDMVIAEKPIIDKFIKLIKQINNNEYFDIGMDWYPINNLPGLSNGEQIE